jgi:hypothetical protein
VAVTAGALILVMGEATAANNGLYVVTQTGDGSTPYILTRHAAMNATSEFKGALVAVEGGTTLLNTLWMCTASASLTVGTGAVNFTQLNSATALLEGTGLVINGNTIALAPMAAGTLLANGGTASAAPTPVAIGTGLALAAGTLTATGMASLAMESGGNPVGSVTTLNGGSGISIVVNSGTATIANSGTVTLPNIAAGYVLGNNGTASAAPVGVSLASMLDDAFGNTQGAILYRAAAGWEEGSVGGGLSLTAGGVLQLGTSNPNDYLTSQQWTAGDVTTLAGGLTLNAGTLSSSGGGGSSLTVEVNGTTEAGITALNFGSGTTVAVAGGVATITAAGGTGGSGATALSALTDVNESTPPTTGQALVYNGTQWQPSSSLGPSQQAYSGPWRGAQATVTSNHTIATGASSSLPWDSAVQTDTIWNSANPTRLTVPAGVSKIRLSMHVLSTGSATAMSAYFAKNGLYTGSSALIGYTNDASASTSTSATITTTSKVLSVVPGDYFEARLNPLSAAATIDSTYEQYFQMEIIELTTSTYRPYDIGLFAPGKPGAGALLDRFVCPRALTLPAGATGAQAFAGIAPTAAASFSIQKNGVTIGSVTFAAGSQIGTFTVSAAVTFAAGDRLELVGPGTQDATMADVAITLPLQF